MPVDDFFSGRIREGPTDTIAIRQLVDEWHRLPYPTDDYPPGSPAGEIEGIDLALLAGDAAFVIDAFLDSTLGSRGDEPVHRQTSLDAIEHVLPHLSEAGRAYFGGLLEILRAIDKVRSGRS
jgi:hypothetical protein